MAILKNGILELDLCFVGYTHEWVEYECSFRVNGEPIVRDELLYRNNGSWGRQRHNFFKSEDFEYDHFIKMFRRVLDNENNDYHITRDPGMGIQVFPEAEFPLLRNPNKKITRSEELQREYDEWIRRKKAGEQFPDDQFVVMVFIDANTFHGGIAYYSSGIWMNLNVDRAALEKFVDELEEEYLKMCEENGIKPYTPPEPQHSPSVVSVDPDADDYPDNPAELFK